ncbi:hypothetical protein HYY71_05275 [Candidatus Woesearchaeota archaeon]|nr:hypothetical protein [Candidatus Woesearchaeota archaeon]
MKNKNCLIGAILIILLAILLLANAQAEPFSESLTLSLEKFNDFFEKEQYEAYAKTIDFFVFSILFVLIYMIGVKYAFKEVKRIERVIAIVLGLTTAFLLVIGGFSIVKLLPFVNWLLYFLLFVLIWWLLKEMKSKFWRFVLALFITLVIAALIEGFFDFAPEELAQSFAIVFILKNGNSK